MPRKRWRSETRWSERVTGAEGSGEGSRPDDDELAGLLDGAAESDALVGQHRRRYHHRVGWQPQRLVRLHQVGHQLGHGAAQDRLLGRRHSIPGRTPSNNWYSSSFSFVKYAKFVHRQRNFLKRSWSTHSIGTGNRKGENFKDVKTKFLQTKNVLPHQVKLSKHCLVKCQTIIGEKFTKSFQLRCAGIRSRAGRADRGTSSWRWRAYRRAVWERWRPPRLPCSSTLIRCCWSTLPSVQISPPKVRSSFIAISFQEVFFLRNGRLEMISKFNGNFFVSYGKPLREILTQFLP